MKGRKDEKEKKKEREKEERRNKEREKERNSSTSSIAYLGKYGNDLCISKLLVGRILNVCITGEWKMSKGTDMPVAYLSVTMTSDQGN